MWEKREAEWDRERNARNRLMREVILHPAMGGFTHRGTFTKLDLGMPFPRHPHPGVFSIGLK